MEKMKQTTEHSYLAIPRRVILGAAISLCIIGCLLLLGACQKQEKKTNLETITAKLETPVTKLYYNASIQPIDSQPVFSPIDARVNKILFKYGQTIKAEQLLIILSSTQLVDDYRKAIADYLQNKESYQNSLISFEGTKALLKSEIISQEDYQNERATVEGKVLSYYQSIYSLEKVLSKAGLSTKDFEHLSLKEVDEINEILNRQFGEVNIKAPVPGVALFPLDQGKKDQGAGGKLMTGDQVKADQLVLSIGDLSGFLVKFDVSEININQVKLNQPAIVTGDAFPGITLKGKVSAVTSQAKPTSGSMGGGLGMFEVEVKVPKITKEERETIHVGMSAKVELSIPGKPHIALPVNAVFTKDGQTMVTKIDEKEHKEDIPVTTGTTSLTSVSIISGVKVGDQIVLQPKKTDDK